MAAMTYSETMQRIEVFCAEQPSQIALGSVSTTIPASAMHSFEGGSNKISWYIHVRGMGGMLIPSLGTTAASSSAPSDGTSG